MMDNIKVISKPKVRFCQFTDKERDKEQVVECCKEQAVSQADGPRIKEIVSLKKSIRIIDPTKFTSVRDKNTCLNNCDTDTSIHHDTTSGNIHNTFLSDKDMPKIESSTILCNTNGISNTKKSRKMSQFDKSLQDSVPKDHTKSLRQKGKENKSTVLKRIVPSKNISKTRTGNSLHVQSVIREKFKHSSCNNHTEKVNIIDCKRSKMTKSQSAPSIMKKTRNQMTKEGILNAKLATSNVMSHHNIVTKNKASPVKKIVLRNISGSKVKTSVEPGVFRKEQDDTKTNDANERCTLTLDVAVEDLAQPGYNSILCTINKLKELEQQKIVTDIACLPSALKSFVHGKISAALDFPLDEAIYKNLVDLSIDEKQLPSTITRSKDPEPRRKDIVPKLSDFFIPENMKEICEAVHIKPWIKPKTDENWNAFKISDRILEWKYSIDDID